MSEGVFYVNVWRKRRTGKQWTGSVEYACREQALDAIGSQSKRIGLLRVTPKGGSNDER